MSSCQSAPCAASAVGATDPTARAAGALRDHAGSPSEAYWHTDSSFFPVPHAASILYSIEVPDQGGNTCFSNMYAAYEGLAEKTKARVHILSMFHDYTSTASGHERPDHADRERGNGYIHPVVRVHPITGHKSLYLGRRKGSYIVDVRPEESEEILDTLWAEATRPEYTWAHNWRVGDVLVRDNQCVMHRQDSFGPSTRRLMHRTQTKGPPPMRASQ